MEGAASAGLLTSIFTLGFLISVLSGLLGIGGGIIMAPALLYLPPLLNVGRLDMRTVAGLTITQGLFACLSGAVRHGKYRFVNRRLAGWMGGGILLSALGGSVASRWIADDTLTAVFAVLALIAAVLMLFPKEEGPDVVDACPFNVSLAVSIAVGVGLLGGMVGQGGSFILIPLMLYVLKLPTRVVIGSNLAIVFCSSLAGFVGKLTTGQIPLVPAAALVVGALPGAQAGSALSRRTRPVLLRRTLAVVVAVAAVRMGADVVSSHL